MTRRVASPVLAGILALALAGAAGAETFTVSNNLDSGPGSLRQALGDANGSSEADNTIVFTSGVGPTIVNMSGQYPAAPPDTLFFDATANPVTIDGGGNFPFFDGGGRATAITLSGVSFTNGSILLLNQLFTIDEDASNAIDDLLDGNNATFVKTGTGTTTIGPTGFVDLVLDDFSDPQEARIEEGILDVDGEFEAIDLRVLAPGILIVDGTVDLTGGVLTNFGNVDIGTTGALNATDAIIESGASLDVGGTLGLAGGTITNRGNTNVASGGLITTSSFNVESGASLDVAGTLDLTGGTITNRGNTNLASGGSITANSFAVESGASLDVAGTLDLTGGTITNRGNTNLASGGSITASSFVVESGGVLTGDTGLATGVASALTIRGRVAPSGTLGIDGPIQFESGSTFEVDMAQGMNQGDTLNVANTDVSIASGAQLRIVTDATTITSTSTLDVVTGASNIFGQFVLSPDSDFLFLTETLSPPMNGMLQLTLIPNPQPLSTFAMTPNQLAVAQTLDPFITTPPDADFQTINSAMANSSPATFPGILDAIGGESLTAFATGRQVLGERTARALGRRVRDPSLGEGRSFWKGCLCDPDARTLRASAWLDAYGVYGQLDGDPGEARVSTALGGATLGADAWIHERVVVGGALGYAHSDLDLRRRKVDASGDTVQAALYAGVADPIGFVSAYGRFAHTFQESSRRIQFGGLSRNARARWDAQDWGAGGEAGLTLLSLAGVTLQPLAGVDWLLLTEESYRERSAGSLALDVDPDDLESLTARFGARVFGTLDMDEAGLLTPELRFFWQREFGDRERVLRAQLGGMALGGGAGVRGPELPRDAWIVGGGWTTRVNDALGIGLDYDALIDEDRTEHQGTVSVRIRF